MTASCADERRGGHRAPRDDVRPWRAYHQPVVLEPFPIALGLIVALLVLLPARRLQLGGLRARWIAVYAVVTWTLGFSLALRPVAARFLVPILVGGGTRALPDDVRVPLELTDERRFDSGMVHLRYRVR